MNITLFLKDNILWITVFIAIIALLMGLIIHVILQRLRQDEKMKYEFITIMAHKFRTPLTHIKWISDNLVKNEQDSSAREDLSEIQKANDNLINLTATLIELMDSDKKQTPYDFETVDLCDFVKTIGESARQTFYKKNILFSITKDNSPILIKMDKSHMEYAIQALLDNALTYTPTGGKVDIFVSRSPASAGSGWRNKAMISVIDNGIGISPIDMPKIFTKFFRAKNAQSADVDGFGIGLHLAQSVIKKHGGKIVGYSEGENHGSRFDIFLPLAS